jgi:hypothetical protein
MSKFDFSAKQGHVQVSYRSPGKSGKIQNLAVTNLSNGSQNSVNKLTGKIIANLSPTRTVTEFNAVKKNGVYSAVKKVD